MECEGLFFDSFTTVDDIKSILFYDVIGNNSSIIVHGGQMGPMPGSVSDPLQTRSGW
jgi:hypothetical protein